MENLLMCRICLATDVRLCSIASHLEDMYERITAVTFKRGDRRPLVACYICHARLQNCYRLRRSCLQSEELLTDMMGSSVVNTQDVLSTNTYRVVSVLHLSLDHALQYSSDCHVKKTASEDISDAKLDQLNTEDIKTEAQEDNCGLIEDSNQCSHLEDTYHTIKEEADDFETYAEYIKLEEGNIKVEEMSWKPDLIGWVDQLEPDIAGPSLQSADSICPKIVKVVLERINLNDSRLGARVSKKPKNAVLKDTEDATTNKRKIEEIKSEQTETMTIKEPTIVTKKIEVEKLVTTSNIIETCDKININLNKIDHNDTSVANDVCEQKFTIRTSLKQNVSSISSRKKKPFSCDTCNKYFSYKNHLKDHIRTHTGEKPYKCNVCNKCFRYNHHLKVHIRTHTGEKPYQCHVCKQCFTYKDVLKNHILTHTSVKPYQCNVCKICFTRKANLKNHIRTHTGEKPYQCNVCKKCFIQKGHLQTHILTHTGDKLYECNVCKKGFNDKGYLKKHIRAHTGEKPYQCNICEKCVIQKSDLIKHIRTHTGEKPYQCNVCKICFNRKDSLKTHFRIHTGEKPYQCKVCTKCFSGFSSFSRHIRLHNALVK